MPATVARAIIYAEKLKEMDNAKNYFVTKGHDYTEGFLYGFEKARFPLVRWLINKGILLEQNTSVIGAKRALKELGE